MTKETFLVYFISTFLVGYVGVIYAFIKAKVPFDWRFHLCWAIPLVVSVGSLIAFAIYQKIKFG